VIGTSAWIERDQFVYFVTMARELGDPEDWGRFRDQLVSALKAAWGLDAIWRNLPPDRQAHRRAQRIKSTYEIVDEDRTRHDPLTDWDAYFDALWAAETPWSNRPESLPPTETWRVSSAAEEARLPRGARNAAFRRRHGAGGLGGPVRSAVVAGSCQERCSRESATNLR
jgi:hypothetical protein